MVDHSAMRLGKRPPKRDPRIPRLARYRLAPPALSWAVDRPQIATLTTDLGLATTLVGKSLGTVTVTVSDGNLEAVKSISIPKLPISFPLTASYVGPGGVPVTEPNPPAPASVDWQAKVTDWPMDGNDQLGDCVIAMMAHAEQQWSTYAQNAALVLTEDQVVALYSAIGGYVPGNPSTDNGCVEVDAMNYWMNTGVPGDKIVGYASVNFQDHNEIKSAVLWFGNVMLGLALPISAQTQDVWDVPPGGATGNGAPGSWGGHAVPIVAYDDSGLTVVTWGATKRMTWAFLTAYCDEAYAAISRKWLVSGVATPAHLALDALELDMSAIKSG